MDGGVAGMLKKDERQQVEYAFALVAAGQMDAKSLVPVIFKTEASSILLQLPPMLASADEFASLVVDYSVISRWSCQPALLDLLLDYLINTKGYGEFATLLDRVRRKEDPNPNPYDAAWLVTERPFFDRDDLRVHVHSLVEQNARSVLRVTPSPDSYGRTYSRSFFEHLAEMSSGTHVISEELSPGTGPSYQAIDLVDAVRSQLGVTDDEDPRQSGSSYPRNAARLVLRYIMSKSGRWIIVLDGFGQEGLNPETRLTVEALAAMIPSGQYRRRVRLVLLDYREALPSVGPADVLEEVLLPSTNLTEADLEPCIEEWDAQRRANGNPGLPPEQIKELAAGIVARAPAGGKERLEFFNQHLLNLQQLA
jgi:hypothetical protein